jgi:outer membrane protein assembly factor BamB
MKRQSILKSAAAAVILAGLLGSVFSPTPQTVYSQSTSTSEGMVNTALPKISSNSDNSGPSQFDGVISSPKQIWETDLVSVKSSYDVGNMTIGIDGTLYVSYGSYLTALDPTTGTIKWQLTKGDADSRAPTVAKDGTIYYPTHNGLYALDPDGHEKWLIPIHSRLGRQPFSPILDEDGNIYFTDMGLYSYTSQGVFRWDYDLSYPFVGVSMDKAGNIYYPVMVQFM